MLQIEQIKQKYGGECMHMEGCLCERRYAAYKAQYFSECHELLMQIANSMPYSDAAEIRTKVKDFLYRDIEKGEE